MKKLIIILVVLAVIGGVAYKLRLSPVSGKVTMVEGEAVAVVNGVEKPVVVGMEVPPGTTIRTTGNAQVDVCIADSIAVRVGENGEAKVSQLERNRYNSSYQVGIDLNQGELLNRVDNLPAGSDYSVRTATAVCGVRGTRFGVTVAADGTEVGVLDGSVTIKLGENGEERTLTRDQVMNIYRGRGPSNIRELNERQRARLKPCGMLNFKEVISATRAIVDTANGRTIAGDIDRFYLENSRYPASITELYGSERLDQFGHPFIYIVEGSKYKLVSIGEDGVPGSGDDVIFTQ